MKAAIYSRYGPPEVVEIQEVEKPLPKDDELLVKVFAATVNRTDCGFRSAQYFVSRFFSGLLKPKNKILGNEFAGVVESIGKNVTDFRVGDKVFGYNDYTFGAHAEYLTIATEGAVVTMPRDSRFEEAAPIAEGAHYALCDLRAAKISAGQEVLINGASGGIGSAAVQLAKHFGATVTAACFNRHLQLVSSLGADRLIDLDNQDFTHMPQRYDLIFDAVGKSSYGACKPLLKPKGIYVSTELGKHSENVWRAVLSSFSGGKRVIFPLPTINKNDLEFLKGLVESGHYRPVIDRKYPLENIVEAYRYVETGQKTGNVVIELRSEMPE